MSDGGRRKELKTTYVVDLAVNDKFYLDMESICMDKKYLIIPSNAIPESSILQI